MGALGLVRTVLGNRELRLAELAWTLGVAGQASWLVVLFVVAHESAGVLGVATVSVARAVLAGLGAPFVATLTDRLPRERVLLGVHLGEVAVAAAAVTARMADAPFLAFVAIAVVEGMVQALHRPANAALLPGVARSPDELVSGNAIASTLEGVGVLVGPAVTGLVLATSGITAALLVPIAASLAGVAAISVVRPARLSRPPARDALTEALAGLRALVQRRHAALLVAMLGTQTFVRGALLVVLVSAALGPLGMGAEGVGYLSAAIGAGGLVGIVATAALIGRRSLALPFSISLAAWGVPILLLGLALQPLPALVLLGVVGIANATLDVAGFSMLQRIVPNEVRGRVFGALEGIVALTVGLGSLVAPALVGQVGVEGALIGLGLLLPAVALAGLAAVRRADAAAVLPEQELALLRSIPMFAPLPMTSLEALASALTVRHVPAGTELIREGEGGDRYYLLSTGAAAVTAAGRHLRDLGPGEGCGEIALLRDLPRTATVTVTRDAEIYALDRDSFLEAVTGSRPSTVVAEELVADRLGG